MATEVRVKLGTICNVSDVVKYQRYPSAMGVRRNISRRGQHRHLAYIFQIADDAMQMDVNKSLYPFYPPKIMPHFAATRYNNALYWEQ